MQIELVQAMATALGRPKVAGPAVACQMLVEEQRNPMGCDNLIVPLLHYSPGFIGGKVTRRGRTQGGFFGRPIVVPVHYEGEKGSGNLDVTMRREGPFWRIYSVVPAK
jgi:hypothetical protein